MGTVIYIEGVGQRVKQDHGGAIVDNKIDLYFESEQDALNFGVQNLEVTILKWGNGK